MALQLSRANTHSFRKLFVASFAIMAFLLQPLVALNVPAAFAAAYGDLIVRQTSNQGWNPANVLSGGTTSFVDDSTAPYGNGALQITTTSSTASKAQLAKSVNMKLSDIATLSYYTKQVAAGNPTYAPSLQLTVSNLTGGGSSILVFEPYWNASGHAGESTNLPSNVWQQWNVKSGVFWSTQTRPSAGLAKGAGGPPFYTLSDVISNNVNANVTSIALSAGTYNADLVGLADGVNINGTIYDFEPAPKPVENINTHKTFDTIQEAIDAGDTVAGNTIEAAAGSYDESVVVNKAVTLKGAQSGISGSSSRGSESEVKSFIVESSDVTIDGFSLTQHVSNQINVAPSPSTGITLSGLVFENNILENYTSVGLTTNNAGNVQVRNNLFANVDSSNGGLESIQIRSNGAPGSCSDSNVSNNSFVNASVAGADANFSCTGSVSRRVTVANNTSIGTKASFTAFSGVEDGIDVHGNTVTNDQNGTAIYFFGSMNGTASVVGNSVTGGTSAALAVSNGAYDGSSSNAGTFTITNNDFSNNVTGISVASGALSGNGAVVAHQNNLSGNTNGVKNSDTTLVDVTNNWWGYASGPKDTIDSGSIPAFNASGLGSQALGAVMYSPWSTEATSTQNNAIPTGLKTTSQDSKDITNGVTRFDYVNNSWNSVPGAISYNYQFQKPNGLATYVRNDTTSPVVGHFHGSDGNSPDGQYAFRVSANFPGGAQSGWSAWSYVTLDRTAPVPPTGGTTTNGGVYEKTASGWDYMWTNDSGVTRYEYQASQNPTTVGGILVNGVWNSETNGNAAQKAALVGNSSIPSVGTSDGVWYWQVRAIDAAGNTSAWSEVWHVTVDTTAPEAPTNLRWVTSSNATISNNGETNSLDGVAEWDASASPDANHYVYKYWNDISNNAWKANHTYDVNTQSATQLPGSFNQGNGVHHFCIVAVDNAGNESACSDATFAISYNDTIPGVTPGNGGNNGGGTGTPGGAADTTETAAPKTPTVLGPQGQPAQSTQFLALTGGQDVLGDQDTNGSQNKSGQITDGAANDNTVKGAHDVKPSTDNAKWSLSDLAWGWWLLILAILAGIWWLIAARRRRSDEN